MSSNFRCRCSSFSSWCSGKIQCFFIIKKFPCFLIRVSCAESISMLPIPCLRSTLCNFDFTNSQNSIGCIYIVRDPRNVITSIQNHYQLKEEQAFEWMSNEKNFIYNIKQRHPKTLRSVTINTELFSKKKSTDI